MIVHDFSDAARHKLHYSITILNFKISFPENSVLEQAAQHRSLLIQKRYTVNDEHIVFNQPGVEFASHFCRELVQNSQRHDKRENKIVNDDYEEVIQPLDAPEISQQVKVCYSYTTERVIQEDR